ncbi:porin PorA family protein [Corynebacterium ammoniagenes]|uniref:DUF3068 domain-containing protein n=2 Tax=Corynebacterium ammoniagenes TaxID=1697 RepID=A0AAV5G333_CORAM|nr:porin PorA family protein [Corynebacterium ammoniagenes]APT83530.1 hypothetical protein CAMM_11710 [Corynebacterium ammoniagenes DSM 20306]AQS74528.1 hypothetical protein CA40472_12010 [Corynebacterium ammoniagenes]EFG81158.1 hypothetical protein HMPREF0281_01593 [Corynebacterium ammoniagenes DSM 20306]GJN43214.1 hypothetical protein CAT723_16930 [Corynebacterium ammoniagenes]
MLRTPSSLKLTTIIALVCLIVGALAPTLITQRTRPLSFKEDISVSKGSEHAQVARWEDYEGCEDGLKCVVQTQDLDIDRHSTTAKTDVDDAAAHSESSITISLDGEQIAEIAQTALLNRESAYPMAGLDTNQEFTVAGETVLSAEGAEIDGIDYFFPSQTEQRSYPYFDTVMQKSEPIDYLTDEKIDGIPTYSFYQQRQGVNVDHLFADPHFPGRAGDLYSDAELAELDLAADDHVELKPYYAVERTVWVEPTTGRIVDSNEKLQIYLAQSQTEAPTGERTLFSADISWDEESTQAELDKVKNTVMAVQVATIVGWVLAIIGAVLLLACAWRFSRQREN